MLSTLSNKHCKTDLTSGLDCLLHEVGDLVEVHGDVGLRHVGQLEPLVLDPERPVELLVRDQCCQMAKFVPFLTLDFARLEGRRPNPRKGRDQILQRSEA